MKSLILSGFILCTMVSTMSYAGICVISGNVELSGHNFNFTRGLNYCGSSCAPFLSYPGGNVTLAQCKNIAEYIAEGTEYIAASTLYGYPNHNLLERTYESGTMTYNGVRYPIKGDDVIEYDSVYNDDWIWPFGNSITF